MNEFVCASCGGKWEYGETLPKFCPLCGKEVALGDGGKVADLLIEAAKIEDPAAKYAVLSEAKVLAPDDPEVNKQILYLGKMYVRDGKADFYRIPFWPLTALERPGELPRREKEKMLTAFFNNPEYDRVAELFEDKTAFLTEYYDHMAFMYVDIMMKGSTANNSFLGFPRRKEEVCRRCGNGVIAMLKNLEKTDVPTREQKTVLKDALIRAFGEVFQTEHGSEMLAALMK